VAPDIDQSPSERRDPDPLIYLPMREEPQRYFSVLASSNLTAAALAPGIRTAVEEVDPYLPTSRLQTMEEILARQRWPSRVFGTLFTVFAVIALVLAAVGIFGVMACTVSQRTTEIGLRIALGADEQSILRMLLGGGLWQIGIGLSLGVVAALAAVRTLASLMTRVSPADPITLLSVVLILAVAGLAACWVPARRALRVDPLTALRHD
jgi:putative ABC transport system permease protein